ncbi:DUF5050 domain-containing protein [Mobilitalea sibirica]|uniref:DUF5050 domain-containing protein n=1 Tax=Mobilitalea sibirica TaxID=1462919 RepID=A0A8J7H0R0_9FIRM|nr:DUF5050 domain-containing protein [Mobilitalea sibirica]MBH1939794.1 DUF5050 domain-containing protein [Mobilitalea sibirica]
MFQSVKKVLSFLVIITILAIVGIFFYTHNRTFYNDEELIGNTSGNIYNGGLFAEINGKIYFSNDNDDGSLYSMNSDCSSVKKVHDDKAAYINVDDNYIYYVRANNTRENNPGHIFTFNNTGVYRINQNGKNIKVISNNPGSYLTLNGNYVYYQNYDVENGLFLYRSKIDGEMKRLLLEEAVVPAGVMNNKLYYTGFTKDHNINTLDLSSFTENTYVSGNFAFPIFQGQYIYYMDLSNNYTINRMNLDGSNPTVLVQERCSTYNITNTGKYLYYQIDEMENSKICRLNLQTMETEVLLEGYYKQIHVTENYVFFKEFENTRTFVLSADGSSKLGTFDPPVLSK